MDEMMNNNAAVVNEATVTQAEVNNAVITQADVQCIPEQKKGMTTGQKLAGLGLIGFALAGVVWLVMGIVKGVKKVIGLFKKEKEAPVQQPAAAPVEQPAAPQTPAAQAETQTQAPAPEQKQ